MRILLAEDERGMNEAIAEVLEMSDYEVDAVYDGEEALKLVRENAYDGIVSDIMMPIRDGLSLLHEVREMGSNVPFLLLTAKTEVDDKVEGMDAGANDYLSKPFAMKELLARIRAMIRVSQRTNQANIKFRSITLSQTSAELVGDYSAVRLSNREAKLLQLFLQNPNKRIRMNQCADNLETKDDEEVEMYISYLNHKLDAVKADFQIVVRDGDYLLEA